MKIKSDSGTIDKPAKEIFDFLADFRNFGKLMPEQIINWQANADKCSFEIKNMASIELFFVEKSEPEFLKIESGKKSPFPFSLTTLLKKINDHQTEVFFEIDTVISPVLSMMVKRPLGNLVNIMMEKLKGFYN